MAQFNIVPSSILGLAEDFGFRGIQTDDVLDRAQAASVQSVLNTVSRRTTIIIPQNTPADQQRVLSDLFGRYQLQPTGSSSSHAAIDTFRRICDHHVVDSYGAENIIEVGPTLSKLASQPALFPFHSCSPNLDNRDRSRALRSRHKIAQNHPHANVMLERSMSRYVNPAVMCNNKAQDCNVEAAVLYASYSLQDSTPTDLVAMMRAHNSHVAVVALSLPIPLLHVRAYHDSQTGARWSREGTKATCNAGLGDAGYTHDMTTLRSWLDGFTGLPLFGEVTKQYGSNVLFTFTLNNELTGCEQYPMLVSTTLDRYALIPSNIGTEHDFLTAAPQYNRLVSYLTIHHGKFKENLFKAALERISVLTPAIILGAVKHTDRWVVTSDERIDIAIAACADVQRALHRAEVAHQMVDVTNDQMATAARDISRKFAPGLLGRVTAALRGERSLPVDHAILDNIANLLDGGRSASTLRQLGALPDVFKVDNGSRGVAAAEAAPLHARPPPPPPAAAVPPFTPERNAFPAPQPWHPIHDYQWLTALQGLPAARGARLLLPFDPAVNHAAAELAHLARPVDHLSALHRQALDNAGWSVDTSLGLLLLGPPGSGKTTNANRICPPGTVIIVPTNDLLLQWQARRPAATILTLDAAMCQPRVLRTAPCILIDEVFKFPAMYIHSYCSLGVPTVGLGDLGQGVYGGHLGAAFQLQNTPIDHIVLCNNILRGGADVTQYLNDRLAPNYRNVFQLPANWQFVTPNVGVNMFQRAIVNRAGHHLVCNRDRTAFQPGATTIGSAQGAEFEHVFVHLFDGDEAYFQRNAGDFLMAVTRASRTTTVTVPNRPGNGLIRYLQRERVPFVHRPNGNLFGSVHPVLDDPTAERELPGAFPDDEVTHPTKFGQFDVSEHQANREYEDATIPEMPHNIGAVLEVVATCPPNPADLTNQEKDVKFRRPDARVRGHIDEWDAARPFHEPTVLHHIGYPFSNSEQLASIYAIFDRYTKPQNVTITLTDAASTADFMFDAWVDAMIDPSVRVTLPTTHDLLGHWLSKRTANELAAIDRDALAADTSGLWLATYFLKAQAKPKFGTYGHEMECGQGIIALNKLVNAESCPLLIGAVKTVQAMLRSNVVYDSGYSALELDTVVATTMGDSNPACLSIDLSQQDSSHMLVHRLFIAKVLQFLGFGAAVSSAYLISRERRAVKGMTMNVLFTVIERLFSGEPGTAFFNWLMSTGTTACTHNLTSPRPVLILGKGDDNTIVPPPHRRTTAISIIKKTGVIQKTEILPYLDFANRIWTTTGRSFSDPLRLLSKFTSRLTSRDNTEEEFIAWVDYQFTPCELEAYEIACALTLKHGAEYCDASDIVTAAHALNRRTTYMSMLRPGKVPHTDRPTLRHCCGHDVVFEDLNDRCAPEAIAQLADVPVSVVLDQLNTMRAVRGVPEDVRAADARSSHPSPAHVSRSEITALAAHFQFSLRAGRDGLRLHLCRGHVSLVRVNAQKTAVRTFDPVFGSLHLVSRLSIVTLLLLALFGYLLCRVAVLVSSALGFFSWSFSVWYWLYLVSVLCIWVVRRYRLAENKTLQTFEKLRIHAKTDRFSPAPVSLRHQPVYGSLRSDSARILSRKAAWLVSCIIIIALAIRNLHACYYLLFDLSSLLIDVLPLPTVLLQLLSYFLLSYLHIRQLIASIVLSCLLRRHAPPGIAAARALITAAVLGLSYLIVAALAYDIPGDVHTIMTADLSGIVIYEGLHLLPQHIVDDLLYTVASTLFRFSLALCIASYRLLTWIRTAKRPEQEDERRFAAECVLVLDQYLQLCTRRVPVEHKARRKFYKQCHPDKLNHVYSRDVVKIIEPHIGSGPMQSRFTVSCGTGGPSTTTVRRPRTTSRFTVTPTTAPASTSHSTTTMSTFTTSTTALTLTRRLVSTAEPASVATSTATATLITASTIAVPTSIETSTAHSVSPNASYSLLWIAGFCVLAGAITLLRQLRRQHRRPTGTTSVIVRGPPPLRPGEAVYQWEFFRLRHLYRHIERSPFLFIVGYGPSLNTLLLIAQRAHVDTVRRRLPVGLRVPEFYPRSHGFADTYHPDCDFSDVGVWGGFQNRDCGLPEDFPVDPRLIRSDRTRLAPVWDNPALLSSGPLDDAWIALLVANRHLGAPVNWTPSQCRMMLTNVPTHSRVGPNTIGLATWMSLLGADRPTDDTINARVTRDAALNGQHAGRTTDMMADARWMYMAPLNADKAPLDVLLHGLAGAGKTATYLGLAALVPNTLIIAISNALADELRTRITAAGLQTEVNTPHVPLIVGQRYDLVIVDEAYALARHHVMALAALGRMSVGAGDPTQITDLGLVGNIMPLTHTCARRVLVADYSFTMPADVMSFLQHVGRIRTDAVCYSPIDHSIEFSQRTDVDDDEHFMSFANQCKGPGLTVHESQGTRHARTVVHVCRLDARLFTFSGVAGHGHTAFTRHSQSMRLVCTPDIEAQFRRMCQAVRGGF